MPLKGELEMVKKQIDLVHCLAQHVYINFLHKANLKFVNQTFLKYIYLIIIVLETQHSHVYT